MWFLLLNTNHIVRGYRCSDKGNEIAESFDLLFVFCEFYLVDFVLGRVHFEGGLVEFIVIVRYVVFRFRRFLVVRWVARSCQD